MDVAFNKRTGEFVKALKIHNDGSYQNIDKTEWVAPKEYVLNWEELDKLGVEEVPVIYRRPVWKAIRNENKITRRPCWAKNKNHPGITSGGGESKEHKIIKNFIVEKIINDDIKFVYSRKIGDNKSVDALKISELPIDICGYKLLERTIQSSYKTRADILLPFTKRHDLFGNGIILEIQLSDQSDLETEERTIQRGIQGYSVAWIFKEDIEEIESCLFLKDNNIKLSSMSEILNEKFPDKIKKLTEDQCRYLDGKITSLKKVQGDVQKDISEFDNYCNGKLNDIDERMQTMAHDIVHSNVHDSLDDLLVPKIKGEVVIQINNIKHKMNNISKGMVEKHIANIMDERIRVHINKKVEDVLSNLNLSEIFSNHEMIINCKKCPKCGKQMHLGKSMRSINWYCKDVPYCDGVISGDNGKW